MPKPSSTLTSEWQHLINQIGITTTGVDGDFGGGTASATLQTFKIDPIFSDCKVPDSDEELQILLDKGHSYLTQFASTLTPRVLDPANPYDRLYSAYSSQGKKLGVDVSRCQGAVNWEFIVKQSPELYFAICKATDGPNGYDSEFLFNIKGIVENGLKLGVYSVIQPNVPAKLQTDALFAYLEKAGGIVPAMFLIDFETAHSSNIDLVAQNVHEYERLVEEYYKAHDKTPVVLIYTYPGYIYEFGKRFDDDNMALATYSGQPTPAKCQITSQRTWLYQFGGWTSTTLPWVSSGPLSSDKTAGIRLQARPHQWIPVDHDVILSPDLEQLIG